MTKEAFALGEPREEPVAALEEEKAIASEWESVWWKSVCRMSGASCVHKKTSRAQSIF
jgi:hypothetical protein